MTNFEALKNMDIDTAAKHIYENVCSGECCCCPLVTPNCGISDESGKFMPIEFLQEDIEKKYNCVIHWLRANVGEV